jgi:hypothetical protein
MSPDPCERIWGYLDDRDFCAYPSLRDALYRLLVAIESGRSVSALASEVERSLDVAATAVRDATPTAVARACTLVDGLVATVAASVASRGLAPAATRGPPLSDPPVRSALRP